MKIKNVTEIQADRNGTIRILLPYDEADQTFVYIIGKNMRINIENSNDIEVFVDSRSINDKDTPCPDCGLVGGGNCVTCDTYNRKIK